MRTFLHSRIEGIIQDCKLDCTGSLTIPREVMLKHDILEHEQIHVLNKSNGRRFVTYAISGDEFCLNGAAVYQGNIGDQIIVLTYELK
jgi:aspartate 1-decarboxylase